MCIVQKQNKFIKSKRNRKKRGFRTDTIKHKNRKYLSKDWRRMIFFSSDVVIGKESFFDSILEQFKYLKKDLELVPNQ